MPTEDEVNKEERAIKSNGGKALSSSILASKVIRTKAMLNFNGEKRKRPVHRKWNPKNMTLQINIQ